MPSDPAYPTDGRYRGDCGLKRTWIVNAAANPQLCRRLLLLSLFEISQIRRRLVFADWHQHAVTAHEIAFLADGNHGVAHVFGTADFPPAKTRIGVAYILFVYRPRSCQSIVGDRDYVVKYSRIGLVAENAFLEDGLVIEMKRQAGRVIHARTFERAARFHFEHIVNAVTVLIDPFANRVARISRLVVRKVPGPVAPISEDSTKRLSAARRNIRGFRRHNVFHGSKANRDEWHASGHAANRMVKKQALAAGRLVRKTFFKNLLIFRSERDLLSSPPWLGLVVRRLSASREAAVGLKNGARRKPARPSAFPVRVLRNLGGLNRADQHQHGDRCGSNRAGRASERHDHPPASSDRLIVVFLNHYGRRNGAARNSIYRPRCPWNIAQAVHLDDRSFAAPHASGSNSKCARRADGTRTSCI